VSEIHDLLRQARAYIEQLADSGVDEVVLENKIEPRVVEPKAARPPVEAPAPTAAPAPADREERRRRLGTLEAEVKSCTKCRLHESRTQTVFARGNPEAEIAFVGEGPGFEEDKQGFPFVGPAGRLLDRMIAAMGYERDDVYVLNAVKCRPPNNRKPEPDEIAACAPYMREQIALVDPKVMVALGATGVEALIGNTVGITRLRGTWKAYKGKIPIMPTFHPAYLLRSPEKKRDVWEDLKAVLKHLGKEPPPAKRPGERPKKSGER
jgi:DNA polymerase